MVKINIQKVLVGGVIAGVVLSTIDVLLYGVVVKAPMALAMQRLPPMASAWRGAEVPWFVVLDIVAGIFLVW